MIDVPTIFDAYESFTNEAYAVDYSNHPIAGHSNFEIHHIEPNDLVFFEGVEKEIPSFKLCTHKRDISFWGVNFEKNKAYFGKSRQCECMFTPLTGGKPFVLLLEMKYCLPKNAYVNELEAFAQLKDTLKILEDNGTIDHKKHKVYLNISLPWSNDEPFNSFRSTQDDALSVLENDGIQVLGHNSLLIFTESHIKPPRIEV